MVLDRDTRLTSSIYLPNFSRALGKVAEYIELDDKNDIAVFQSLIPSMVSVLHQTMEAGNEDGARKGFDVFETLLILVSPPCLLPPSAPLPP